MALVFESLVNPSGAWAAASDVIRAIAGQGFSFEKNGADQIGGRGRVVIMSLAWYSAS